MDVKPDPGPTVGPDGLGAFLRSRRHRRSPEAVGLPRGLRRTPGLRREELALLAGVSADYYTRLEQGRAQSPSSQVLEALARALGLDAGERTHLFTLINPGFASRRTHHVPSPVRPSVQRLLDGWPAPAWLVNHSLDVLAWNSAATALFTDWAQLPSHDRNMLRFILLDPAARQLFGSWQESAGEFIGKLRTAAARWPQDPAIDRLVADLSSRSPEFRTWWPRYEVAEPGHGRIRYHHPMVGDLTVDYETLRLSGEGEQQLVAVSAEPGSVSADRLRRLADLARTQLRPVVDARQQECPVRQ